MSDAAKLSRRQMLAGSVVGAAATAAGSVANAAETVEPPQDHREVHLRDTAHTRAYYALARD